MHDRTYPLLLSAAPPAHDRGTVETQRLAPSAAATPWATRDHDPDRAVTELGSLFPDATIWFGDFTGSYWALIRGADGTARLIEGATPADLARRLDPTKQLPQGSHQAPPPPPAAVQWNTTAPTACPTPPAHRPSSGRVSRARGRCRGRRSLPRTWGRSGRC